MNRFTLVGLPPAPPLSDAPARGRLVWAMLALLACGLVALDAADLVRSVGHAADERDRLAAAQQAPARLRRAEARLAQARLAAGDARLGGLPAVLSLVRESADETGVRLDAVEPQRTAGGGADQSASVRVEVSGNGVQVGAFVDAVERGRPPVPLTRLVLSADPDGRVRATIEADVPQPVPDDG